MWCPACRADVAAELSLDSRHFQCARCQAELGLAAGSLGATLPAPSTPTDAERNARELLARWSAQNLLSPPTAARPIAHDPMPASTDTASAEHSAAPQNTPVTEDEPPRPRRKKKRRVDRSESRLLSKDADDSLQQPAERAPNWGATVGQVCAYFGIGLITCGTSIVVWGYFGGPANFAPTGWLITTIGQMFLFLGVVTLISSGMEQTTSDVADRIELLGKRLIRIETRQKRHQLAGPHELPAQRRRGPGSSNQDDLAAEPG